MATTMDNLTTALNDLGLTTRRLNNVVFVGSWGIHASLTGNIQIRSVHYSSERCHVGTINSNPADVAAEVHAVLTEGL